jgi:hypothetical protein
MYFSLDKNILNFKVAGFSIPGHFVVGYALDLNEHFRDLEVYVNSFVLFKVFFHLILNLFLFTAHLCYQAVCNTEIFKIAKRSDLNSSKKKSFKII